MYSYTAVIPKYSSDRAIKVCEKKNAYLNDTYCEAYRLGKEVLDLYAFLFRMQFDVYVLSSVLKETYVACLFFETPRVVSTQ